MAFNDNIYRESDSSDGVTSLSSSSTGSLSIHDEVRPPTAEEIIAPLSPPPVGDEDAQQEAILHSRAYQLEMLEASLKQNVIVVMDTGSGKTQVAILRMQAELEKLSHDKIIWFLTPSVALCDQQFKVIRSQIPGVITKLLTGNEGPETWSTAHIWNAFLHNVKIVVSTLQVLSDALLHSFVSLERLSLMIFDEAHNTIGNSPGRKVMNVYRKMKDAGLPVPAVLGLTASPIINHSQNSLNDLEDTLDAVCKTPAKHRGELLAQVNRPDVVIVQYKESHTVTDTQAMESLRHVRHNLDIKQDPFIKQKMYENTERSRSALREALLKKNTPSIKHLKSLYRKSVEICRELGTWAADYFINMSITQFLNSAEENNWQGEAWGLAENKYIADALRSVQLSPLDLTGKFSVTSKVKELMEQLLICPKNTLGIIFVKETATVSVLHSLLSSHPLTRSRFRIGTMVGLSRHHSRKRDFGEVVREDSILSLESFRLEKIDLIIATNVLEEGIDVPACNLVVCFDKPSHLKSFIQRRGRARMRDSKLILFQETDSEAQTSWERLEEEMKKKYEAEDREKEELSKLEETTTSYAPTFSTTTGSEMDIDSAKSHLEHFCASLFSKQFVECRPYYLFHRTETTHTKSEPPLIKATVVLPNSLPPHLRRIDGACSWYSEKKASKDAAFEAYKKLYEAGLVNEHLLPFKGEELVQGPDSRLAEVEVSEIWNPWPSVARAWRGSHEYRHTVRLSERGYELCEFEISLPVPVPNIPAFNIFWSQEPWTIDIGVAARAVVDPNHNAEETMALITLALRHRFELKAGGQHIVHFHSKPGLSQGKQNISIDHLGSNQGTLDLDDNGSLPYLIRDTCNGAPYFFHALLPSRPPEAMLRKRLSPYCERFIEEHGVEGPWLALRKWPRRRDFLHEIQHSPDAQKSSEKPYETAWPVSCCRVDSTPIINVQFGSLIPSITHMIEIYLVAQELSNTVLKDVSFQDLSLVVRAISASSARESEDYQRLEFLGDALLKLLSTISVTVEYSHFLEGYLSIMRARIVSNSKLCDSTMKAELDKFIITKEFTGHKWRPLYVDDMVTLDDVSGKRRLSTKVLADIVESLLGASFQDGGMGNSGMDKALQCLVALMPSVKWHNPIGARDALLSIKESRSDLPSNLASVEKLLGYTFGNKALLLEALTHGSYVVGSSTDRSYERLEFIGDAILDYIIVLELWKKNLPQSMMSPLRAACVNADLIGFLGMEWSISQDIIEIVNGQSVSSDIDFPFWKFMRHSSLEIGALQKATEERHKLERRSILDSIETSSTYPWALLAHLHIPKFFSDIFEAVLGAIWLDSGDFDHCRALVERIKILPYLDRILSQGVDVVHPKNKVGELAEQRTVRYEVERDNAATAPLTCKVYFDDELITEVGEGIHKDEVITKAAEKAYEILKARERKCSMEM